MEYQEKVINNFSDYSINTLGQVKNIKKGNILKLFDTYYIDLYKQEAETKKRHRVKLLDLMIEHFILKPGDTMDKYYISFIDNNLLNCSLDNLKVKPISYFSYKYGNKFMLYNSYTKTFKEVNKIQQKFKHFHLFKGYEGSQDGVLNFVEDFRRCVKQLRGYKLDYEFFYSHTHALDGIVKKLCGKDIFNHEPIDRIEYIWMDKSTKGTLIYCNPGIHQTYGYDFKSAYSFVMSREHFKIPTKKGKEIYLEKLPDIIEFGYYHVNIKSEHPEAIKIFRFNINSVYTHCSLKFALKYQEEFDFKIELVHDNKPNAYIYSSDCLVSGKSLFGNYYDTLMKIRTKYPDNFLCKFLLSALWGTISRQYKKVKSEQELEDEDITIGMDSFEDNCLFVDEDFLTGDIKYVDITKPFVHNIRLKTWLRSTMNNIMGSIFINVGTENIVRVYTDGFASLVPLENPIENLIPDPKYTGKFEYVNSKTFYPV